MMKFFYIFISTCMLACISIYMICIYTPGKVKIDKDKRLTEDEIALLQQLKTHIVYLSEEIGERHYLIPGSLEKSAQYIRHQLESAGLNTETISYGKENFEIVSVKINSKNENAQQIIIGAHYDTVTLTLGADDNASGISALIELAKYFKHQEIDKHLRFVAFPNEESPFYGTHLMGSKVFVDSLSKQEVYGMVSLEMLGYFSSEENSQRYPWPFKIFYPDTADFIAFVGNMASRSWLHESILAFRFQSNIAAEGLVAPEFFVPDISRSDQVSFWKHGIPAFMITDTANYRSSTYHFAGDVIETLDMESMTRVVMGIRNMLLELAKD